MFQISAFARLGGVSSKVLRDYDKIGLFRPAWIDRHTGYRLYSPAQLPLLRRILALRDLGLSLSEIRSLAEEGADLAGVLEARRRQLEAQRREAERRLATLGITLTADPGQPDVVLRDVAAELVAVLAVVAVGGDVGRAFYELELAIRDAGVRAPRPPGALVREQPLAGQPETEVFVPVRRAAVGLDTRRLPQIRAATILHRGAYQTLAETRRALDTWITAAGLRPSEPVRILYLQFGAEDDLRLPGQYLARRTEDYLTEIQVPVG